MLHYLLRNFLLLVSLFCTSSFLYTKDPNALRSIYHHVGAQHTTTTLELGTLVMFFSSSVVPTVLEKRVVKNNKQEYRILFPHVTINDESVENLVRRAQSHASHGYKFTMSQVQKPLAGLLLTIVYDPQAVIFQYDTLVSSAALPGYVFRFINKKVQDELTHQVAGTGVTQLAYLKKPRIIIDPGHGGKDPGAIGVHGIKEKKITLALGKQLGRYLRTLGFEVLLTRTTDKTVLLDERTVRSNQSMGDLFISVHANAALNPRAHGIETFYYPHGRANTVFTSFKPSRKNVHTYFATKEELSNQLAASIQKELCAHVAPLHKYHAKIDRSVKYAPLQVLVGTNAPSVLVEVGFISNPYEKELLEKNYYQRSVVQGIADGISNFYKNISKI